MANDTFKALAHPLRRDIVERLSRGVATVCEVSRDFGVSKPTISRHLKMLEQAGVVSRVIRLIPTNKELPPIGDWRDPARPLDFGTRPNLHWKTAASVSAS
jgi:predicted ArsR family transcriptional regulator